MSTLFDETHFHHQLALESRKSERIEGHRYGLALVDLKPLGRALDSRMLEKLGSLVSRAMRETDITGWYEQSAIGVILTTLKGDRATIESVVKERITEALAKHLSPVQLRQVSLSCHLFPDDEVKIVSRRPGQTSKKGEDILKRIVDVLGSGAAVIALSPLFLAVMVVIKVTSRGPVFFKQSRVGEYGREFTFLKFRSMVVNNDPSIHRKYVESLIENKAAQNGHYKIKDDPRVTRVGRFLRRTSLDELPQFLNALKGDMSLVGPRPPIPYELEKYSRWHRRRVLEAKPGITGVWQVHGRSRTTFDEMVRMDLRYIRNRSLWLDLKLLIKTPYAVLKGSGAY